MFEQLALIRKALVPVGVMLTIGILASVGIAEDMTVGEAVEYLVLSGLVWAIPNRKV